MVAACAMLLDTLILLLLVVDSGVVVGLLRGGRLRRLRTARLKALPLLVAALVLQLLLGLPGHLLPGGRWGIGSVLLTVSLLLLLVVVGANARLPGMALLAFGVLANLVVVGLNGGMPVSAATPQQAPTGITSEASQLGPQYLVAGPETRLSVLGAWVGVFGSQTVVSVGDVLQYLGLLLLIQGLMVGDVGRRPKPRTPAGGWTTLLRVAWLAILLGLLLQLAVLLVAAGFGTVVGSRSVLVEAFRTVSWSLLVCVGVALGRVAAKGRVPLEGVTGLLAAPLALTAANMVQKGVAEALNVAGTRAGPVPLWVLALKAAEYAFLGLALGWVGRRAWGAALGHVAAGLATGMVFGGAFLALVVQAAPVPGRLRLGGLHRRGPGQPCGRCRSFSGSAARDHLGRGRRASLVPLPRWGRLPSGHPHGRTAVRAEPRPLGMRHPPPRLCHATKPGPSHPPRRAPPGLALLGPRPRTTRPRTRTPPRWRPTDASRHAWTADQGQPAGPPPVGLESAPVGGHGRRRGRPSQR
jgi:hypothetical protein